MRRVRRFAPWVLLLVATVLVAALLSTPQADEPLHPRNNGPGGAQAVAQVLQQQGVEVQLVTGSADLDPGDVTDQTTVLLPHTDYLGPESGPELVASLTGADRLVVLVPSAQTRVGEALGLDVSAAWGSGIPVVPDCDDPFVREGDRLSGWDVLLSADGAERTDVTACYPPGAGHNLGGGREGALLTFPAAQDRPETVLVGAATSWTNARVTEEANAALALRLLGGGDRLVWVLPQPGDAGLDAAGSLWDVLPRNLTAAVVLLTGAVLALALWQGRRLGPVVVEPLPAVVRASETTSSRGRLYRQAADREHALRAVQAGARRRTAPRLGLPRSIDPEALADAVATATGRTGAEVRTVLVDPGHLPDDAALVHRVRQVRALEEQLSGSARPSTTDPSTTDPSTTDPSTTEPGTSKPAPTERTP